MPNCPRLSSYSADTQIISIDNVAEIIPDTFDLSPGTSVTVSCNPGYTLVGQATFRCLSSGIWNYPSKPYCSDSPVEEPKPQVLDEDAKIMIGVVTAIAALIILSLVIMIIAIWVRDRRKRREREKFLGKWHQNQGYHSSNESYRGRDGSASYDMGIYSRSSRRPVALPYDFERRQSYDRNYPDERIPGYKEVYDELRSSRRTRSVDDLSDRGDKPYTRDWVSRSSRYGRDDDFVDRAGLYRPKHGRNSYYWRDAKF